MRLPEEKVLPGKAIEELFASNRFFGIAGNALLRPGFSKFMVRLEYEHYSPDDPNKNVNFNLFVLDFMSMEGWFLIAIPIEDRPLAEKIANEEGLRFSDGIPTCIGGDKGVEEFPIKSKHIWSISSLPDSPIYKGQSQKMLEEERDWIIAFFTERERILNEQEGKST